MSWEDYGPMSFQADGEREIKFLGRSVQQDGKNRLAPRKRPFRQGAKQDSTGSDEDDIIVEGIFHNDVEEPDVDNGMPMWPDTIEAFVKQLKKSDKTGTLNLPWKRKNRVKALNWTRRATADEHRGGEIISVHFVTDNEDKVDREAMLKSSASGNLSRAVEEAQFDALSEGAWNASLEDLTGFASDLVGWINAPREYAADVVHASNKVTRAVEHVFNALSGATGDEPGQAPMNDPNGFPLRIRLLEIMDLAASAEAESRRSRPATRTYIPERDTDIWAIAVELEQDANELILLNDLDDPTLVEAGVGIRVFAE